MIYWEMGYNRDLHLDSIAGLLILVMVAGHCGIIGFDRYSVGQVFGFYMGWFFYKAGLFHKNTDYSVFLKRLCKRLLIPFLAFSILGLAIALVLDALSSTYHYSIKIFIRDLFLLGTPMCNSPLWFLLSLFFVKLISHRFEGSKQFRWLFIIALLVAVIHEIVFPRHKFVYLGNISLGIACYAFGVVAGKKRLTEAALIIIIVLYLLLFVFDPSCLNFFRNHTFFGNYISAIATIIPGILIVNGIFYRLKILNNKYLGYVGCKSLPVLVMHYPISLAVNALPLQGGGGVVLRNSFCLWAFHS